MDSSQDFYIIAVYTAHCSVNDQDYIILIINYDCTASKGLRIILRPSSYFYTQIKDQLESQDITLTYADINEYILKYPINIGRMILCSFQAVINKSLTLEEEVLSFEYIRKEIKEGFTQANMDELILSNESFTGVFLDSIIKSILDSIKRGNGFKGTKFNFLLEDNVIAFKSNLLDVKNEQVIKDLWAPLFETYSLELYSIFCKGNYLYSSLRYQKDAIKNLIAMIHNDYDNMIAENIMNTDESR